MKISTYLKDLHSHAIYDHPALSKEFQEKTGRVPTWPHHSVGATASTIGQFKGCENIEGDDHELVAYGWEIAEGLARAYANKTTYNLFSGRGSRFQAALQDLEASEN